MSSYFGLEIPQNAIDTLLRRVRKRKYVTLKEGVYRANRKRLETLSFRDTHQHVLEMQELLLENFKEFCRERFDLQLNSEDAEAALRSFFEEEQFLVTNIRQRVEKVLFTRRRGTHRWTLRTWYLKQNGRGSERRRAIACAADLGPWPCEASNLLVFCPAATISASMFAFSSILSLNLSIPCHSLASPKSGSTHTARLRSAFS